MVGGGCNMPIEVGQACLSISKSNHLLNIVILSGKSFDILHNYQLICIKGSMVKQVPSSKRHNQRISHTSPTRNSQNKEASLTISSMDDFEGQATYITSCFAHLYQVDDLDSPIHIIHEESQGIQIQEDSEEFKQQSILETQPTHYMPPSESEGVKEPFSEDKNRYYQAHADFLLSYEHSICPHSYHIKRNKRQDGSQFWFQANRFKLFGTKSSESSAKGYAKRKDQEFRAKWELLEDQTERKEKDITLHAVRYLGSFPEQGDNLKLLQKLAQHQKNSQKQLELLEAIAQCDNADSIFSGISLEQ